MILDDTFTALLSSSQQYQLMTTPSKLRLPGRLHRLQIASMVSGHVLAGPAVAIEQELSYPQEQVTHDSNKRSTSQHVKSNVSSEISLSY